jgi:hypothetical protein
MTSKIGQQENRIGSADAAPATCRIIDWYAKGQSCTVDVGDVRVTVRFVGRKGRRGRIAIEAPVGAVVASHSQPGSATTRGNIASKRN